MDLTPKQRAFADYYIQFGNATEAAKRAGYSEKTAGNIGDENLKKPHIKAYIEGQFKKIEDERVADATEVLIYLTKVMRGQTKEETIVLEGQGEGISRARIIEKAPAEKDRLKAAEMLAKRYGILIDKMDLEANVGVTIIDDIE